jgi:LL-diaminopimelate aminotransferase
MRLREHLDIFGDQNRIAVMDPVYPVYVDTNVMAGHTGPSNEAGIYGRLLYLPCTPENGFMPEVPRDRVDLIYLCSPNNPTGAVATRKRLGDWVEFALDNDAVILYDAAYEALYHRSGSPSFDL